MLNLSVFFQQNYIQTKFISKDIWVILSKIEQSIKNKIEAVGTPLKDWDIQINYGIKTGCNEAFIISEEKRNEILSKCLSDDEKSRTEEIIRPILRGRDIKRYGYNDSKLYLINTHNGIKEKGIPAIDIKEYPSIKAHLDSYWELIEKRADQGDTPYNLRNCAYLEEFDKPKICWNRIASIKQFALVESGIFIQDSMHFVTGNNLDCLNIILNSKLYSFFIHLIVGEAKGGNAGNSSNVKDLTMINPDLDTINYLLKLYMDNNLKTIDNIIYKLYSLNDAEIDYIENSIIN